MDEPAASIDVHLKSGQTVRLNASSVEHATMMKRDLDLWLLGARPFHCLSPYGTVVSFSAKEISAVELVIGESDGVGGD